MTVEEIAEKFPLKPKLLDRALVFLWVTSPRQFDAFELVKLWGLYYRGVAFNWVKTDKYGNIVSGKGVRPTVTHTTSEFVWAVSNVEFGRPLPVLDESVEQVVPAPYPKVHSRKPERVRRNIERVVASTARLEMFARGGPVPGWDRWGNEVHEGLMDPPEMPKTRTRATIRSRSPKKP